VTTTLASCSYPPARIVTVIGFGPGWTGIVTLQNGVSPPQLHCQRSPIGHEPPVAALRQPSS
jgi:hypothetical protein